jgi:hypothetical protein
MSKNENDAYRQMSPQESRCWLLASCVVASAFTAALLVMAVHNFGSGSSPGTQQAKAEPPAIARAGR